MSNMANIKSKQNYLLYFSLIYMKDILEVAGSIFACVPLTVHVITCFLDHFLKTDPKALHILATQVFIPLDNRKDGIDSLENV